MKQSLIAAILCAAFLAGCGPSSRAPGEYPFEGTAWGTIETLQSAQVEGPGNARYFEHPLAPEPGEEIVVRLDDGSTVIVLHRGDRYFERGERVRVVIGAEGAFLL